MNHYSSPSSMLPLALPFLALATVIYTGGCSGGGNSSGGSASATVTGTPGAEQAVGERLFMETRFAQAFSLFMSNGGNVNDPNAGDPSSIS